MAFVYTSDQSRSASTRSYQPRSPASPSFKPHLAPLATGIRPVIAPFDATSPSEFHGSLSAAIALSRSSLDSNASGARPDNAHEIHAHSQSKTESYDQLGLGLPGFPLSRSASEPPVLIQSDAPPHSQPIQIQSSHANSPPESYGNESLALSPAMHFLNIMNSPASPSTLLRSRGCSLSEPEKIGPYTLGPVFASGGFSVIRKATSPTGVVAVKVVSHQQPGPSNGVAAQESAEQAPLQASLSEEIKIWSSLHHENILPLFTSHLTATATYLVSLYCPAGSLFDILQQHSGPGLPQDDAGTMFRQIVRGLRYLHEEAKIVHGDIKLENILVDEMGACRIADFGLAKPISCTTPSDSAIGSCSGSRARGEGLGRSVSVNSVPSSSSLPPHLRGRRAGRRGSSYVPSTAPASAPTPVYAPGSLPYAAPELLFMVHREAGPHVPNPAQDIWALGCVLHALLYGRLPFIDAYEPRLVEKIMRGRWERSPSSGASASKSRSRVRTRSRSRGWSGSPVPPAPANRRSKSRGQTTAHTQHHSHAVVQRHGRQEGEHSGGRSSRPFRREDGGRIGSGAKRMLRGCLVVDVQSRWNIAQVDEVAWNVGWGENDLEESEIIVESRAGSTPPRGRDSSVEGHKEGSALLTPPSPSSLEEPDAGWITVDEDEGKHNLLFPEGLTSRSRSRITYSASTTHSSLPPLSPSGSRARLSSVSNTTRKRFSDIEGLKVFTEEKMEELEPDGAGSGPRTPVDEEDDDESMPTAVLNSKLDERPWKAGGSSTRGRGRDGERRELGLGLGFGLPGAEATDMMEGADHPSH